MTTREATSLLPRAADSAVIGDYARSLSEWAAVLAFGAIQWPWLLRFALLMGPTGFIAVIAGWVTTEVGRQPYTVYGLLRTAESASPLAAPAVAASLIAFIVVYFAVFGMGTWYLLRLMHKAPQPHESDPPNAPSHAAGITPASGLAAGKLPETTHG